MTILDWDDLRFFDAAMREGTLSAAAQTLGVAQATMSRRISGLEEALGHALFDRSRGGLIATEAAQTLAPHVEAMRTIAMDAQSEIEGFESAPEGLVRLAVPPGVAFDIAPTLHWRLLAIAPDVRLEILAANHVLDLSRREADIAIRSIRPTQQDLVFRRLPTAAVHAYAHPDYVDQLPARYAAKDVDWIQYADSLAHIPMAQWVHQNLGGRPPAFVSDNFLTMRQVAIAGGGAMLLPAPQAEPYGLVRLTRLHCKLDDLNWYLVTLRALQRVPRVRAVLDLVVESAENFAST